MLGEERAISFPENVHRHAQKAYPNLDAAEDNEQPGNSSCKDPRESKVGQNEGKHVLENDQACE